jgi:hypothetical protein
VRIAVEMPLSSTLAAAAGGTERLQGCKVAPVCTPELGIPACYSSLILDVIMLEYPLKVRPMPGIWVQSVPVTAIPWGGMNTEQRNTLQRSIREDT